VHLNWFHHIYYYYYNDWWVQITFYSLLGNFVNMESGDCVINRCRDVYFFF
jgi:hypothetical protein